MVESTVGSAGTSPPSAWANHHLREKYPGAPMATVEKNRPASASSSGSTGRHRASPSVKLSKIESAAAPVLRPAAPTAKRTSSVSSPSTTTRQPRELQRRPPTQRPGSSVLAASHAAQILDPGVEA